MSNKTPTDAGSEMWFPGLMYSEAYLWACTVDEDTARLILQAYNSDEIDWETAEQLWWGIVGSAGQDDRKSRL